MKNLFPIFILILSIYVYGCANQVAPTGGPKDTIPPTLTKSIPPHKSINYNNKTFKLYFDEFINVDKIKQDLIITPFIENEFQVKSKKNELTVIFEDSFDSLTTYTINFGNGVTDITEKNPAVNLSIAFSTGPIIDSIYIKGTTIDLYKNNPLEKVVIALFNNKDTLDMLTGKPRYFAKTNKEGEFLIENIKNGFYKLYAFEDDNNNMINDPEEEMHAFIADSIDLNNSIDDITLRLQLLDIRPLKFNRGKFTGLYYDLSYNKNIHSYSIQEYDNKRNLPIPINGLSDENKAIRFYKDSLFRYEKDSIGIIVTAQDSLKNATQDTVYIQFRKSKRKPSRFESKFQPKSNAKIDDQLNFLLSFFD